MARLNRWLLAAMFAALASACVTEPDPRAPEAEAPQSSPGTSMPPTLVDQAPPAPPPPPRFGRY